MSACGLCRCRRMLSKLPHLYRLELQADSAPDDTLAAPAEDLRWLLPALTYVWVDGDFANAALCTLARWTRVRPRGVGLDVYYVEFVVVVKAWSMGWLRLMLEPATLSDEVPWFVLVDDADVYALNAAAAGLAALPHEREGGRGPMGLFLGEKVSVGALQQLQVSTWLVVKGVLPEDVKGQVPGWAASPALTPARFLALVRPDLERVVVEDASALDDSALQEMASQALGLTHLTIQNGAQLSDEVMWALCGSCPKLTQLSLSVGAKVTAAGVLPLLTVHKSLVRIILKPAEPVADVQPFARLVAGLRVVHPSVEDKRWVFKLSDAQLSIVRWGHV
jgi:hypothetical protein